MCNGEQLKNDFTNQFLQELKYRYGVLYNVFHVRVRA
jgi:hypothetical protein